MRTRKAIRWIRRNAALSRDSLPFDHGLAQGLLAYVMRAAIVVGVGALALAVVSLIEVLISHGTWGYMLLTGGPAVALVFQLRAFRAQERELRALQDRLFRVDVRFRSSYFASIKRPHENRVYVEGLFRSCFHQLGYKVEAQDETLQVANDKFPAVRISMTSRGDGVLMVVYRLDKTPTSWLAFVRSKLQLERVVEDLKEIEHTPSLAVYEPRWNVLEDHVTRT